MFKVHICNQLTSIFWQRIDARNLKQTKANQTILIVPVTDTYTTQTRPVAAVPLTADSIHVEFFPCFAVCSLPIQERQTHDIHQCQSRDRQLIDLADQKPQNSKTSAIDKQFQRTIHSTSRLIDQSRTYIFQLVWRSSTSSTTHAFRTGETNFMTFKNSRYLSAESEWW